MVNRSFTSQRGFTLIELMIVVCITGILAGAAVMQIGISLPSIKADGGMRVVMGQLNQARDWAITHRRNVEVTFNASGTITLTERAVTNGPAATVVSATTVERPIAFALFPGVPDTPDAFGNATSPRFSSLNIIMFNPEGVLTDSGGAPVNGTVFLTYLDKAIATRAVTVMGATGRVRGYRWNGRVWSRV